MTAESNSVPSTPPPSTPLPAVADATASDAAVSDAATTAASTDAPADGTPTPADASPAAANTTTPAPVPAESTVDAPPPTSAASAAVSESPATPEAPAVAASPALPAPPRESALPPSAPPATEVPATAPPPAVEEPDDDDEIEAGTEAGTGAADTKISDGTVAAKGGWLAPTTEQVQAGLVRRTPISSADLRQKILAGHPINHVQCNELNLANQTIDQPVRITKANLSKLCFAKTVFLQKVHFKYCLIEGIDLARAKFKSDLVFESCEFRGATAMNHFGVEGALRMRDCTINSKFAMRSAGVGQTFDAWDTTFNEWVDFTNIIFNGTADFRSADFDAGLVFTGCKFKGDALFRGASVAKKFAMQKGTVIEGCLDLQKAKLRDYSYLDDVQFGADACVSVWNCMPQALLLKWQQVDGRLQALKGNKPDHAKAAEEIGVLKNNYQRLNWLDDEDSAYYHFKREQRLARKGHRGIFGEIGRGMEWLIFDVACKYGTSPMRVLGTAAILIFAFAVIYAIAMFTTPSNAEQPLQTYTIVGAKPVDFVLTALVDSTSAFVSGFDAVDKNADGWVVLFLTLEGLLGMLVLGLFIVTFSRKVIR